MPTGYRLTTPRSRPAALATIDLRAGSRGELDQSLDSICGRPTRIGSISLRSLAGVDRGLVVRPSATEAILMPHGGPAVIEAILERLAGLGLAHEQIAPAPTTVYPEAATLVEAAALAALSRASSPLAVDLLLEQPARWNGVGPRVPEARDLRLRRLIDPPLVVVIGPPNVGKSSLLNALAGRDAALVDDAPGTTLDHIGATIDLAGLVVRWVDTPGRRQTTGLESEAIELSMKLEASADLVILAGDHRSVDPREMFESEPGLVVATRSDLGLPDWPCDAAVSSKTGEGLRDLVSAVRERLIPSRDLESAEPWVFSDDPSIAAG